MYDICRIFSRSRLDSDVGQMQGVTMEDSLSAAEIAEALVRRLYEDEWLDVHQVVALIKVSRSRFDELKAIGRFPKADRWVAGKQIWSRLTVERWKRSQEGHVGKLSDTEKAALQALRQDVACQRASGPRPPR